MLDNVLANAVSYNREGGQVVISGSAGADRSGESITDTVVVTVTDTGPGIPADEFERIFARFYRLDPVALSRHRRSRPRARDLPRSAGGVRRLHSYRVFLVPGDDVRDRAAGSRCF